MTPDGTIPPFIAYTAGVSAALVAAAVLTVWAATRRRR